MDPKKLAQHKRDLKHPYTGMTDELAAKIDGIVIDNKPDFDLNRDGKIDKTDLKIAGQALRSIKRMKINGNSTW